MIKFGTDGWRAVIGDTFTFSNLTKVSKAHAKVLRRIEANRVIIGYDHRFLSEEFAKRVFNVFKSEGFDAFLTKTPVTTPQLSFSVKYMGFDGGVMITASHNPPQYNGYKIKEGFGGSATPSFVSLVEKELSNIEVEPVGDYKEEWVEIRQEYINKVREYLNMELFREREMVVVHDAMYGTSAGLLKDVLKDTRIEVFDIRNWRDPLFGGHPPEPIEKYLGILKEKVRTVGAQVGIANDGDGDRVALVDEKGNFVNSQMVYVLLLLHLIRNKGLREGCVVKTVSTTYLADRICSKEGIELREVPVGFKNINEVILKEKVIFGGEESGGYGFPDFLPERDGLLSALYILEYMLLTEKPLSEIINEIMGEYGSAYYKRVDMHADSRVKDKLKSMVENPPDSLGRYKVSKILTIDGLKLIFPDDSWILFRASGTEPLIRIYAEAPTPEETEELIGEGKKLFERGGH